MTDLGPALTPAGAAALHDGRYAVAWLVLPAPDGSGVVARPHTFAPCLTTKRPGGRHLSALQQRLGAKVCQHPSCIRPGANSGGSATATPVAIL